MMPNALQYPIALFGALRAGLAVVNTNPLYTAPELEHQLADSGCDGNRGARELRARRGGGAAADEVEACSGDGGGRLSARFPNPVIVNFVIRRVRKQVKPWKIAGAADFKAAVLKGKQFKLAGRWPSAPRTSHSCNTPAARPASPKAPCSPTATCAPTSCRPKPGSDAHFRDKHGVLITPIPLYHIFALMANCLLFARLGWKNVLIINPRDFPAVIAEMKKYPFAFISGVNTLFNALMHAPGFDKIDFSASADHPRRRHGGPGGRRQALERGHRRPHPDTGVGPHRDLPRRLHKSARHWTSTARSACRSPPPRSSSRTTRARTSPSAKSARSASAARK